MTNPPSVASQGSGGTQTYPKGILKKSVQAAFEGEMPPLPPTSTASVIYHLPLAATATTAGSMSFCVFRVCACPSVLLCVLCVLSPSALAGPRHRVCVLLTESYCGSESPARRDGTTNRLFPLCDSLALPTLVDCLDMNCGLHLRMRLHV